MHSAVYRGWVRHRRRAPRAHAFRHRLYMLWLDLDELDQVFEGRALWSLERANLMSFRRADYLGDAGTPLRTAVLDEVERHTGERPGGPVRLLTHVRALGYAFNPVSFYYCYADDGATLHSVVAEITNTPWGERHRYVLGPHDDEGDGTTRRHRFPKAFHVSPFMRMEQDYDWRFSVPDERLLVHMENREDGELLFDATLSMTRHPLDGRELARCLLVHPWITGKVILAIHAHAALLWLKRVPFRPHPRLGTPRTPGARP